MKRNRKNVKPTTTSLVWNELNRTGDFHDVHQLSAATGRNANQVSAALHHFRVHKAVDSVVSEDRLWWFATPESDDRTRQLDEITADPITHTRRRATKAP